MEMAISKDIDIQKALDEKALKDARLKTILPFAGLILITVFFIIVTDGLIIKRENLKSLITQVFTITLVGSGAVFVYGHNGLDFSIGSTCGLAQFVCIFLLMKVGAPVPIAILGSILTAVFFCSIVALCSIKLQIHPFVGSLCVKTAAGGLLSVLTDNSGGQITLDYAKYLGFNNEFLKLGVLIVIVGACYYLFEKTKIGRIEKAIGGNERTVYQAGINVSAYKILAYAILGACVGIAAFFQMTRLGHVSSGSGSGLEFDMMIAMVLGGFPMNGGSAARFRQFILGGVTATILTNGLILWGVEVSMVNCIKGFLFILIVAISYDRSVMKQASLIRL